MDIVELVDAAGPAIARHKGNVVERDLGLVGIDEVGTCPGTGGVFCLLCLFS